jgi:hypothetical protein
MKTKIETAAVETTPASTTTTNMTFDELIVHWDISFDVFNACKALVRIETAEALRLWASGELILCE